MKGKANLRMTLIRHWKRQPNRVNRREIKYKDKRKIVKL